MFIVKSKNKHTNGGVAQLGEHLPCKQGVMGSNPIISTSRHAPTGNRNLLRKLKIAIGKKMETGNTLLHGLIAQQVRARA